MGHGALDYVWRRILCGLPFNLHRMFLWIIPGGRSFDSGIAILAFNVIIGGVIGSCVLVLRLLVVAWYVPLTAYRLIIIPIINKISCYIF